MAQIYKVPLVLTAQPDGGYTITSPASPELITDGDTLKSALVNIRDAFSAVTELYEDFGKPLPLILLDACSGDE